MSRQQREPLRSLQDAERVSLVRLSRSASAPAAQVARARALLAVTEGRSYTATAHLVGRQTGDTVARWVAGFNNAGLGRVCKRLYPEQDHADVDHGKIVVGALFIAGGDAPGLLEAVDQALDLVA